MGPSPVDLDAKVVQACQAGEEFYKLYYETIDKKRHLLSKLYLETAQTVWNGNKMCGKEDIIRFFSELPVSEHKVELVDCQPIAGQAETSQLNIIVKTSGTVTFASSALKTFHQNFMLTSQNNVWKIVGDSFRFYDKPAC